MLTFKGLNLQYQYLETLPTKQNAVTITFMALSSSKWKDNFDTNNSFLDEFFWLNIGFSPEIHS